MYHPVKTGHTTFDRQSNASGGGYIGTGNVSSNTQMSSYVRGAQNTACNGYTFKQEELQKTDLKIFEDLHLLSNADIKTVKSLLKGTQSGILYSFYHHITGRRIVHGWMLTTDKDRELYSKVTGPTYKSENIMRAMKTRITPLTAHQTLSLLKQQHLEQNA
jgi:hypothetical protein